MGKYDFSSPLAVGGAAIHDLLTQRKAEERQRLLDEVMVKDAASARAAREAQVRASEDQLKTEAQKRKLADRAAAMEGLEIGQQPRTPEQAKILEEYGMVESPSVEEVPVEATPFQMPSEKQRQAVEIMQQMGEAGWSEKDLESTSKDLDQAARMSPQEGIAGPIAIGQPVKPKAKMGGFVGTPKQREEKRVSDSIAGLRVITEDPNLSPDEKRLQVIEAMGPAVSQLPAGFWQQFGAPDKVSTYTFDQETGKTTEGPKVPAGSQFFTRARPPREPRQSYSFPGYVEPGTNKPVTFIDGIPHVMGEDGKPKKYTGGIGAKPTSRPAVIPPAIRTDLNKWRAAAIKGTPGAAAGLMQAQENTISDALQRGIVAPHVAEVIRDIFANDLTVDNPGWIARLMGEESPDIPTLAAIIENYANVFPTEEDYEQFKDLLTVLY